MAYPFLPAGAPAHSPWGAIETAEEILHRDTQEPTGIFFVTTAGHGGYYVPQSLIARVPQHWRDVTWNNGQGNRGWFEEDCDWSLVALSFPECFIPQELTIARQIARQCHEPKLYAGAFDA